MRSRPLAALSLLFFAHAAGAEIYKVVGADGRVSYTDQPPSVATPNVQLFKHGRGRPTVATEEPDPLRRAQTRLSPAVRDVLNSNAFALEGMHLCMQVMPGAMRRYGDTLDGWKIRNAEATERAEQILAETAPASIRARIKAAAINDARQVMAHIRTATPKRLSTWCESTSAELASGNVDLARQPAIARLLQGVRD